MINQRLLLFLRGNKIEYLLFERPSLTRYAKSLKASSTGGRDGKCDSVFGWAGTIWIFVDVDVDPLVPTTFFLSESDKSLSLIATSDISGNFPKLSSLKNFSSSDFLCLCLVFKRLSSVSRLFSLFAICKNDSNILESVVSFQFLYGKLANIGFRIWLPLRR